MDNLFGRTIITTAEEEITPDNVVAVIQKAVEDVHNQNSDEIDYLYNYYKGDQPILERIKEIRPEINNMIVENRAKEIVDFKTGYLIGEPIQYIGKDDSISDKVQLLNDMMNAEDKDSKDSEIVEWQMICGTAFRMVLPDDSETNILEEEELCPFEIYTLDPRQTFVVYSAGVDGKPMAGVYYVVDSNNDTYYSVYTNDSFYKLKNFEEIVERQANPLGRIPIIEYPANNARLGAFETVITMLDAINKIDSNRVDGIEQFIQSLIVCTNCKFDEDTTAGDMMQAGIVNLTSVEGMEQKIQILSEQLNQSETQTLKDDLYDTVLTICSIPNRASNMAGDTGIAVMYRNGWSSAEASAKKSELIFKKSEREFLKLALQIASTLGGPDLKFSDLDIKFTRRNYEDIATKVNTLVAMLNNDKIAPKLAFIYSNMFPDPESAYAESMDWYESHKTETENSQQYPGYIPNSNSEEE